MASSSKSQCFGQREQEDIPAEITKEVKGNDDSVDFYLVQIGTRNGKRWRSSGLDLHDEIPIVPVDDSDQFWYLERNENSPLWSFHTKSPDGNKLYITYNKGNPSDQKVSLQYDHSGDKSISRNFMLFLQPDGKYAIATPSSLQRMLGANDEVLVLTDVDHPTADQDWIISNDLTLVIGQTTTSYVQVQEYGSPASKWISTNARPSDRVSVSSSSEEEWIASGTVSATTFKVPTQEFYASKTDESEVQIIFETKLTSDHMREFKIARSTRIPPPAVLLQTVLNDWYVGTQGSVLQLKAQDFLATGWYLMPTRMVFTKQNGTEDIFPAFKGAHHSISSH